MRQRVKYIILDRMHAILFGEELSHKEIAFALREQGSPTSAGFLQIDEDGVYPYGESTTLELKAKPETDTSLLSKTLGYEMF